jgi:NADH:ubiquinone oxidoreductase subunit B-like Fe-S oxidoreductase
LQITDRRGDFDDGSFVIARRALARRGDLMIVAGLVVVVKEAMSKNRKADWRSPYSEY